MYYTRRSAINGTQEVFLYYDIICICINLSADIFKYIYVSIAARPGYSFFELRKYFDRSVVGYVTMLFPNRHGDRRLQAKEELLNKSRLNSFNALV